mgnify:CR=1 FL=1
MRIELRNHPAQARHPYTDEPLWYDEARTKPVPLITDQRAVFLDGVLVGYCGIAAGQPLTMTALLPTAVQEEVRRFVTSEVGAPRSMASPPRPELVAEAERKLEADADEPEYEGES